MEGYDSFKPKLRNYIKYKTLLATTEYVKYLMSRFLCVCKKYKDIRESLYNNTVSRNVDFASLSSEDKFMYLMKFQNVEVDNFFQSVRS